MPLMHDMKFRKEPDARKEKKKERKKETNSHGHQETRLIQIGVSFIGTKGKENQFT